jgi:hypothetical protein
MYVDESAVERDTLLQGDILRDVQHLAALNLNGIHFAIPSTGGDKPSGWSVSAPPILGSVMVLSHSCELDRRNTVKVTSIILAPLRDVHKATTPDKIELLVRSNLIDRDNPEASFFKYFYLEPAEAIAFDGGALVDFSKPFSVRNQSYDYLLERKVLQLRDEVRDSMSLKLGLYYHRSSQSAA